jgi:rhodanese-related sulfurtransferase
LSTTAAPDRVDAATALGWLDDDAPVTVIDVRSAAEYESAHVAGSVNVPLPLLGEGSAAVAERLDRRAVLVCASGVRASQARLRLAAAGAQDLHVLDGGVSAWAAAGGEVVTGRSRWALDRQVRLVAGVLVLAGVLASLAVPGAVWLAGAIGAGLTVSALTDTCTLGRLLSFLPYNRGPREHGLVEVLARLPERQSA